MATSVDVPLNQKKTLATFLIPETDGELDVAFGKKIAKTLQQGKLVTDKIFNSLLSPRGKRYSHRHWTPVGVANRAATLLTNQKACRILDVGSGLGKFCIVGALTTPARFVGVERREWLVSEAKETSKRLGIKRVQFKHGDMAEIDWSLFDGVYLYNPFYENIEDTVRIDASIPLGKSCYRDYVTTAKEKLGTLRKGARVVTHHGFGGRMPSEFIRTAREPWGEDFLDLWIKKK